MGARQAEWEASIAMLNEICNKNPSFAAKQNEMEESIAMQEEDPRPETKRPRVGDVGQEPVHVERKVLTWAALAKTTQDFWTAQTGLDSQTSTQERAKTAQDIVQPLMKDIARAVQSSQQVVAAARKTASAARATAETAGVAASSASGVVPQQEQEPLMKQSSQPGGEAAAPQVDYTDVLDNLDRIYNSIGQVSRRLAKAAFAVQGAASTMISCAENLGEEGRRIRAAQQALRCSPICEQYKTQAPPLARSGFLQGSGNPSRVMISCAYCGLTTEHSPICDNYGKTQAPP